MKEEKSLVPTIVYSNNSFHFKSHTTPSSKSRFGDLCVWNSEDAAKTVDDRFVARNNIELPDDCRIARPRHLLVVSSAASEAPEGVELGAIWPEGVELGAIWPEGVELV